LCERRQASPSSHHLGSGIGGSANGDEVPYLVRKCIAEIDQRGLTVKGIYRLSGVKSRVEQLCQSFETDEQRIDLSEHHPNVVTNVLKLYFRELPEPLLTFKLYPQLISLAREEQQGIISTSNAIASLSELLDQLPKRSRRTLSVLIHHLSRVAKLQDVNQMSSSNLGIVFGPTLLRPSEGASSLNYLIETPFQTRIIELMIDNVEVIFSSTDSSADFVDTDIGHVVMRSNLSRLSTGDCHPDLTSPGITSWFAPAITQDLLQELAKEEPRFQKLQDPSPMSQPPPCTDDVMNELKVLPRQQSEDQEDKIYFL
jgi:hypothetical protein